MIGSKFGSSRLCSSIVSSLTANTAQLKHRATHRIAAARLSAPRSCAAVAAALAVVCLGGLAPGARAQTATVGSWAPQSLPSNSYAHPSGRTSFTMAYDAANGTVVLFGGSNGSGDLNDTWTWDGTAWTQQSPANSPPARFSATMAYDAANGTVVLFGGNGANGNLNDTWTWDGTNWTQQSPANSPPARYEATMAYDAAAATVVLFGGSGNSGNLNDTWTWNGTTWTQQTPVSSPPARYNSTMAYDAATATVVLFGGRSSSSLNDTWTWNGATWTQQTPTTSPSARASAAMAYDAGDGTLVLFGGAGVTILGDTWTWNGATWTQQAPATSPSARFESAMAYDEANGTDILFGGAIQGGYPIDLMWTYAAAAFTAPSTAVGTAAAQMPVSFTITGSGTLGTTQVLTQGAPNLDFTLGTGSTCTGAVTAGSTCTVNVAFTPRFPGLRIGAVELTDSNNNVIATAYISGTGTGPLATFTPGTISTVAGNGAQGYSGDNGAATSAELNYPSGVSVDGAGNLYIVDYGNSAIRKVTATTGKISTLAGNGTAGYSGDNGAAASAELHYPYGVSVDGAGNVYIADTNNNRVREVTAATGEISTVAGNGTAGGSGDGGAATAAELFYPEAVSVDGAGNLYIVDAVNQRIRKVTAATGEISTVAGNGMQGYSGDNGAATAAELNNVAGISVDGAGDLYIADYGNNVIREVTAATGIISTVAGNGTQGYSGDGGTATGAELSYPVGVSVDAAGNLYIGDQSNHRIRKVTAATGDISTVAGNGAGGNSGNGGAATGAELNYPDGISMDGAGNLYIADYGNNIIRKVTATAAPVTFATPTPVGGFDGVDGNQLVTMNNIGNATLIYSIPATVGVLNPSVTSNFAYDGADSTCSQVAWDNSSFTLAAGASCKEWVGFTPMQPGALTGSIINSDASLNVTGSIQAVELSGTATAATGTTAQTTTFPQPATPVAYSPGATATLTASASSSLPVLYSVISGPATLSGSTLTFTGLGTVVVEADQYGNGTYSAAAPVQDSVQTISQASVGSTAATISTTMTITTAGTLGLIDVLTQGARNLDFTYVTGSTDPNACAVGTVYTVSQTCTVTYSFTPTAPGQRLGAVELVNTAGTAVLGNAYISGTGTGARVDFTSNTATTALGGGSFNYPETVATDAMGNVYVASSNTSLQEIPVGCGSAACVQTIGSGFDQPRGIAVDGSGDIFVADYYHSLVKEIVAVKGVIPANPTILTVGSGFTEPYGIAVDGSGNVYVGDELNNAVKEIVAVNGLIPANPTIRTLGSGFNFPYGVAVDGSGNVYVADYNNKAVKEIVAVGGSIPANPTILTLGSGFSYPQGVAVDAAGDVFVADTLNGVTKEIVAVGGVIPATNPTILTVGSYDPPYGIALDGSGNLYIAGGISAVNELVLATPASVSFPTATAEGTTDVSDFPRTVTMQNTGNAALTFPIPGMSTNPSISNGFRLTGSSTCPQLTTSSASAGTLAEGGLCTDVIQFAPALGQLGMVSGQVVVADNAGPNNAQTVNLTGTSTAPITTPTLTVAGTVAVAGSNATLTASVAYVGSSAPTGAVTFTVGSGSAVTATCTGSATPETCTASYPTAGLITGSSTITATLASDSSYTTASGFGTLTVVGVSSSSPSGSLGTAAPTQTAMVVFATGGTLGAIDLVTQGTAGLDFNYVTGSTDPNACNVGTAYTAGQSCTVAYKFTPLAPGQRPGGIELFDGSATPVLLGSTYLAGQGQSPQGLFTVGVSSNIATGLDQLRGLSVDAAGNLYASEQGNGNVDKFAAQTGAETVLATGIDGPGGTAVDGMGNVYFGVSIDGTVDELVGGGGAPVQIASGWDPDNTLLADAVGDLFSADENTGAIYEIAAGSHAVTTVLPAGQISRVIGMALDPSGNLYAADFNNNQMYKIAAGSGTATLLFSGNGLIHASGIVLDAAGNLYVTNGNGDNNVQRYAAGTYAHTELPTGYASSGIAMDGSGNLLTMDGSNLERYTRTSTPTLSFANTAIGSISADQVTGFENDGNQPLNISAIYATTNFSLNGSDLTCSATPMAVAATCNLAADLTPHIVGGPLTGSLIVTDNTLGVANSSQAAPLSGTATQATAAILVASGSVGYGTATVNLSATVTFVSGLPPTGVFTFAVASGAAVTAGCSPVNSTTEICTATYPAAWLGVSSYTITAALATDADYVSSSSTGTLTVQASTPVVAVASLSAAAGSSPTLSATVTYSDAQPSGAVTFTVGTGTAVTAACTVSGSAETCTTAYPATGLPLGANTITAALAADSNYTTASGTGTLTLLAGSFTAPTEPVGTTSATQTATVVIGTPGTLGAIDVMTQGAANLDFIYVSGSTDPNACVVGTAYTQGQTCTVTYSFTPRAPGQRLGGIQLIDSSGAVVLGTTPISGTGTGPLAVFPGSTATTTMGGGLVNPWAVAADAKGNVYVTDTQTNLVQEIPLGCNAAACMQTLGSGFRDPQSVAVDGSGDVYVADTYNAALEEIVAVGGVIPANPTIVGLGSFSSPQGVAVDGSGNVFVADAVRNTVNEILAVGGSIPANPTILTLGSGFIAPVSVAVDGAGDVYVADQGNNAVKEIVAAAGSIPANPTILTLGTFTSPASVALDAAGDVYVVANYAVNEIMAVGGAIPASNPTILTLNGFSKPLGVAVGGSGNVYGADRGTVTELSLVTPPGLNFATLTTMGATDTADGPQVLTLQNAGNAPLAISGLAISPASFAASSGVTTCSTTTPLAPGLCTAGVSFAPQTPGAPLTGTLTLTDNTLNAAGSMQTAPLSGTAVQAVAAVTVSPVTIAYGTASAALSATVGYVANILPTGAVTFQVDSGAVVTATCTGSASPETCTATYTTSALTAGPHTITGVVAGDAIYPAAYGTAALTVSSIAPTMVFNVPNHSYGDAAFTVAATSNSTGAFTYTVVSGPATVSGGTVTLNGIGTVTLQASQAADSSYNAASAQTSFSVSAAGLTVTASNATRFYGAANPTFTGTVTGQVYTDSFTESFATSATLTSPVGSYTIVPSATGTNLGDYTVTTANGSLSVTKAPTTTNLTASASNVSPNQTVTLTASVASTTSGTPTGTVSFFDNGTLLTTLPLTGGVAMETTTLSAGTAHTLTASYSGDANFLTSATSAAGVTVTVGPLAFTFTTTSASTQTVAPGHTATYSFMVSPTYGVYAGALSFSVSGLPAGATATFTPSTIPANGGAQAVTMTVQTPAAIAHNQTPVHAPGSPFDRGTPLLALLLLPALGSRKLRRRMGTSLVLAALLLGGLGATAALTGCGSANGFLLQQTATYPLTVTATAGTLTDTQPVTLIVQ